MPEVMFAGPDGRLEGRYHHSKQPNAPVALVLHPHPLHGGTMNNRVVHALYGRFQDMGFSVLRFNFRGVGRSQGRYDGGIGEISDAAAALGDIPGLDLTVELITHRFTPGSREVLQSWYPGSDLEMDPDQRAEKRTKFGSVKFVYPPALMGELKSWFRARIGEVLPAARILYWT